ncbi:Phosphotransferase KptA/Tpt1 [Pseudovibrio sp. FO-BEG1]|uniref:RNA 2'-phosphotransferase n=1 Tax=Pseudovibrio sp. (strain FO-BEG1) TaxID=911045 RepID=UPI000238C3EA|nr:RNA 2'-phosphotransferase [Pseudovibrio sp. FO-BEG1]AEV36628.1 Phosphotransferase KptA/Tpt1 [Pseudovibrio sp. FO-BEG1]
MSKNKKNKSTEISKFLSFVLRHKPQEIGLQLDPEGWASVAELIEKARPQVDLTPEVIEQIVIESDKQRFKLSDGKTRIRANQGHSVQVDLKLKPVAPPATLYHGTAERNWSAISEQGLKPQARHHVHLSQDTETATKVGQRHGKPIVLTINAEQMHQKGIEFFLSDNGVWLTEAVLPEFISR